MKSLMAIFILLASLSAAAEDSYLINPGDVLKVFVWNEEQLSDEVVVRPDGKLSVPLAGHVQAAGKTPEEVERLLRKNLNKFLKDEPVVTVSLLSMGGNVVYVIGKVNGPGVIPLASRLDVAQVLALAGGLNSFADENSIKVLRRSASGVQRVLEFDYKAIKKGKKLESNFLMKSGDLIIVP